MIKIQQLQFVDYHTVADRVNKLTKRNIRDWKRRCGGSPSTEYCDFWHVLLEYLNGQDFCNGCYLRVNFRDVAMWEREGKNREWVIEIAEQFHAAIPDKIKQQFVSDFDDEPESGETELDKAQITFLFAW